MPEPTEATLITPEQEAKQAEAKAMEVLTASKVVLVTTADQYREAASHFSTIKGMLKDLEARRVAITGPINQSLKLINEGFKRPKEILEDALRFYETPMLAFKKEEERRRQEAEAAAQKERDRLEAEARAAAKAEEDRLNAARAEALEAEARAKELAEGDDPFEAAMAEEEAQALREKEAAALRAAQDAVRASTKIEVPAPVFVPKTTAAGTSFRKNWKWRVVDAALIPRQYLVPDEQAIGLVARTDKENANIPGIEFYPEEKIGG